ncbi:hypothetical protein [Arthrobacter sp. A2-55]|uniref:hypothetical protein n=1 Tax=Arthrobacter sp. A2-55 TaxID=2897337 RepID=UPI0021CD82BE|nr:hypothetical protein [Arthrobacter sp. A2-55]MCU6479009.1 hypothetical protein [Arthrobacter sp. A2-55]
MNTAIQARVTRGVPTGGQFASAIKSPPTVSLGGPVVEGVRFDTAADAERFDAARKLAEAAAPGGSFHPAFTRFRADDQTDIGFLEVDGRTFTVNGTGTDQPHVSYESDSALQGFRIEAVALPGESQQSVVGRAIAGARHDAACLQAWTGDESHWMAGDEAHVTGFVTGRRGDGRRSELSLVWDGRHFDIILDEPGGTQVEEVTADELHRYKGTDADRWLDMLANDFDEDGGHAWGTGADNWRAQMTDAADCAEQDPGYRG